jgi:hypothetical protein
MQTIIGVFRDRSHAEQAIHDLKALEVQDTDISYVGLNRDNEIETTAGDGSAVAEGATSGAVTGGVIGAIAGLAVANGILPGLGTLFVAGPIATALGLGGAAATTAAGAMTGAAAGGLIGALGGLGVSETDARDYEERVRSGDALVTAKVDGLDEARVRSVYETHGAEEVRMYNV